MKLTWTGVAFVAVLAVTLASAVNDNNSLALLLGLMLLSLLVVALVKGGLNTLPLRLTRLDADNAFANERVRFRGTLQSGIGRAARFITLTVHGADDSGSTHIARLDAGTGFELTLPAQPRGRVAVDALLVSSRYPAGLFSWSVRYEGLTTSALIYPAPVDYLARQSQAARREHAAGDEFDDLQAWQPGDSLSGFCWKTYARSGKRMRRRFTDTAPSTDTYLDWGLLDRLSHEQKLSQLCHWVVEHQRSRTRFGLRLPGRDIPVAIGAEHTARCLAALATK